MIPAAILTCSLFGFATVLAVAVAVADHFSKPRKFKGYRGKRK